MFDSAAFSTDAFDTSAFDFGEIAVIATQIAVGGWYDRDEEDRPIRRDDDLEVIGLLVAFLNSV